MMVMAITIGCMYLDMFNFETNLTVEFWLKFPNGKSFTFLQDI